MGGTLCDLEKGLYCVFHGIILSKLIVFGIQGKNLEFYKFYLHDRYIRTAIYSDSDKSGTVSNWGKIRHGGPQRSSFSSINK